MYAKRAEERTLRVFLCPCAVRAAACSAKADGTERYVGRGVSRARTSEPPFSNRGVQIGQDRRTTQNFEQNQSETEVKLQNKTWITDFRVKRMQIGISEQDMALEAGLTEEYYRRLKQ